MLTTILIIVLATANISNGIYLHKLAKNIKRLVVSHFEMSTQRDEYLMHTIDELLERIDRIISNKKDELLERIDRIISNKEEK
jgi:hypothetical protein